HFSLPLAQMAIDINNALVHAVWSADVTGSSHQTDWLVGLLNPISYARAPSVHVASSFVQLALHMVLVVMILILALTYVVRFALLAILLVVAPLAALSMILPETKSYARAWVRLFEVTVFMQFAQVLVLHLLLIMLLAGMFAPLPEPGQVLFDPLPGALVTQPFGCSDLDLEPWSFTCPSHHFHSGVDLEAAEGTPVYAASAGVAMV